MKKKGRTFAFRGKYLLLVVIVFYGVLFLSNSETSLSALQRSIMILLKVLPIFIAVILFTAMLNYFIKPKQIASHLGKESGAKGWLWALTAGVISHGPMYAWYPLLEDLRGHGMRDELIVVFFFFQGCENSIITNDGRLLRLDIYFDTVALYSDRCPDTGLDTGYY